MRVTATPGERNDFNIRLNAYEGEANRYYAEDGGATITPGPGCGSEEGKRGISCQASGPVPVVVDAGDGDDKISSSVSGAILGGPGNDTLKGGTGGPQSFDGGPGNDSMEGDATGYCTDGNRARGQDTYVGGDGVDTVRYDDEDVASITASIDGIANDGAPGENDNVGLDVENMTGTDCGGNTLIGSAGPNALSGKGVLSGLGGDDVLTGSFGDDKLDGGDGNDKLVARNGNDMLDGGPGDDFLEGGFDDDVLTGGPGKDSLVGDETRSDTIGTGNDIINADDGIGEGVSCGPGSDVANVDALDTVPVDTQNLCEVVKRSSGGPAPVSGPGPGPGPGGGGTTRPGAFPVTLSPRSLKASKSGRVTVRITCRAKDATGCNGTIRLASTKKVRVGSRSKKFVLGTRSFSIGSGKSVRVTFKLSRANRSALRRLKRVKLTVRVTERAAKPRTAARSLTLRR